ncbi:MAG: DUF4860 domain-containing protein [bacterium]|nr:DUF4860 domain-containing protein [bacterium]
MEQGNRKSFFVNFICTIGILGALAVFSLVLANVGVRVYKNIVTENADNYKLRTSLAYVTTKVRQMDQEGKVYIEKREGIDVLVMEQVIDHVEYETLIYYYAGSLYEVFHEKENEFYLSDGAYGYQIMEINVFSMQEKSRNLLIFTAKDSKGKEESITLNLRTRR